jgi:hypothetical protein
VSGFSVCARTIVGEAIAAPMAAAPPMNWCRVVMSGILSI